jgi:hypothetical protein
MCRDDMRALMPGATSGFQTDHVGRRVWNPNAPFGIPNDDDQQFVDHLSEPVVVGHNSVG